jgi:hypothetical protein
MIKLKFIFALAAVLIGAGAFPASATTLALNPTVNSTRWNYEKIFFQPGEYDPPIVVTTTGGTVPYSCAWQKVGGDLYQTAASPNSCSTIFNRPLSGVHQTFYCEAGWIAVVTDATGATAQTPVVVASYYWELGD